jgi:hypothetical protein
LMSALGQKQTLRSFSQSLRRRVAAEVTFVPQVGSFPSR